MNFRCPIIQPSNHSSQIDFRLPLAVIPWWCAIRTSQYSIENFDSKRQENSTQSFGKMFSLQKIKKKYSYCIKTVPAPFLKIVLGKRWCSKLPVQMQLYLKKKKEGTDIAFYLSSISRDAPRTDRKPINECIHFEIKKIC